MRIPLLGLILGLLVGWLLPFHVPLEYSKYMSVALMAGMDSVFGGIKSYLHNKFDSTIFVTGFFTNTLLAILLTFIGEKLSIDLYFVAILTFGLRMFENVAIIRRHFLKK